MTIKTMLEAAAKLCGLKPEDLDLSALDEPVRGYVLRGDYRDPEFASGGSFSVDGERKMGEVINSHGCTTGRWSGKGTAKPNKPRNISDD